MFFKKIFGPKPSSPHGFFLSLSKQIPKTSVSQFYKYFDMKTSPFSVQRALLALTVLFFVSCHNPRRPSVKENLVAAYPSGSRFQTDAPLSFTFKKVPELFKGLSQEARNQVVTLQPAVKGKLFQVSPKTLLFQPEKPLAFGREYAVTLHLDKLFNHPASRTFRFTIRTAPLEVALNIQNMAPYLFGKKSFARLSGTVQSSGNMNAAGVKRALSAKQGDKPLPVKVSAENSRLFRFTVDSIERTDKPQTVTVALNGKLLGAKNSIAKSYTVPSLKKFTFLQYNLVATPALHLELVFSNRLSPGQNLKGMVYFADGTPVVLSVKDNIVKVFPKTKLNGSHKLVIQKNIRSRQGFPLDRAYTFQVFFKMASPEVRFIGKGNVLPGKKKWIIPFEAVNLRAVDVVVFKIYANNVKQFLQDSNLGDGDNWTLRRVGEYVYHQRITLVRAAEKADNKWKSYAIDLSKMVKADPGAIYRISLRFRKPYAMLGCVKNDSVAGFADSSDYYASGYYYPDNYQWAKRNDPCDVSYYTSNRFKTKNFLATDIGLTVKNSDGHHYRVFARDIISAKALNKVHLTFYSYQNQELGKGTTNAKGVADISMDKAPFLLVAQWKNQFAYLKLTGGNALSYSKFNTSGVKAENGLKGMIFGERGVWRPGDTLFLTFVLQDREKSLPAGFPVNFAVYNARHKKIFTQTSTQGADGFYVFKVPTQQDAPTGRWQAVVKVGNNRFVKNLRVETVLPNRLKIRMTTDGGRFTPQGGKLLALQATWLHGGLASGLKADVTESIAAAKTVFKGYKNFIFDDPAKTFNPEETQVFNGKLDSRGEARFKVVLPEKNGLPGMLRLTFVAKVFEAGGRFSIDQKSFSYAPFGTFVGLEPPETGSNGYLETGRSQKFKVVTLNSRGQKASARKKLKVEIYKLDWSWWYNSNSSNLASYISRHYKNRVFSKTISTQNGEGSFSFQLDYPQWGRYYIRVSDPAGGHSTGTIVYFDWPSSYGRQNRQVGDATLLSLSTDKPRYRPGEEAVVHFPAPAGARALISIEKNNKVLKTWWVDTQGQETSVRFKVTSEMTPNVYLFVSVIQPHLQTQNDLPIRSYGVVPVMVDDPETFLKPVISMPDKLRPDSRYTIRVSEANHRQMTYVLAVVDEGLLDLTHFQTPSLHGYFYRKEALAVNTWDFYNDVIGAYGMRLSQVFAIGGGRAVRELGRKKLNRFQPVVAFLGPFTLPKGSNGQTHLLKMPNYMGSVRVMVMAGNGKEAYGSADKTVKVTQPLMVLASMPRTLVPGETLKLPVTVFALENKVKKVQLQVTTNDLFSVSGGARQEIDFQHTGQKIALVEVKTANREGIGKARITVSSGKEKAFYDIAIRIRNPNRRVYKTESHLLEAGKSLVVKPVFVSNASAEQLAFSVSKIPVIHLEQRLQYLLQYPYGCVEQLVSKAFVQLYLNRLTTLSGKQLSETEDNINSAIQRLSGWQAYNGGFSYWPGSAAVNDWGTSYAGNFLVLAKENGYYVPSETLNAWIAYQKQAAGNWNEKPDRYGRYPGDLNQAYRLYTLALAGKPAVSAMNRMREMSNLSDEARLRLAAAYALLNEKQPAKELVNNVRWNTARNDHDWRGSFGSQVRNEALALETYLLMGDKTTAFDIFKEVARALGSDRWMSTQTTAYALYAVALFTGKNQNRQPVAFAYSYGKEKTVQHTEKPVFLQKLRPLPGKPLKIDNRSGQTLFVTVETSGIPLPGKTFDQQQNLQMKVTYYSMDGKALTVADLPQGKDFYARVDVFNPSLRNYDNLALSFITPSGWEILNTRMLDVGSNQHSSSYDYLDIRDDRVNIFFQLDYKRKKHFYILLNASYPGRYFMAPVSCRAMYDNTVQAAVGGGMVEVGK